ncbi:diaminopimelate epimerase [Candidatus Legionella polyplacis]|uniref:diaminopimelate epimerase n=1 Tax=Candidatus Legionella polyplacis TaxID=2005262 RepID=UPI000C1EE20B|nr:diaminopimelate epimerase [Candidatus Legionella polyplacis]ATW01739.1 diaminopimelate epimerase [Candidatus Legionella polyplacis]
MKINFTKMHSLGNDFIIINGIYNKISLTKKYITKIANRHTGIGFDQCIILKKSNDKKIDFLYTIYNSNGKEVFQCCNGVRCLYKFITHNNITQKKRITIATKFTKSITFLNQKKTITTIIKKPKLINIIKSFDYFKKNHFHTLFVKKTLKYKIYTIDIGNPHAIIVKKNINKISIKKIGKQISKHSFFKEETNVEFMQIINSNYIKIRVYERGCGETKSCGSGAIASAIIAKIFFNLKKKINVLFSNGKLSVYWPSIYSPIYITGPAKIVYEGVLQIM